MAISVSRASWIVAASVGAVEAMKDQGGLCRWNNVLRSLHQNFKNNMGSEANRRISSSSSSSIANSVDILRKGRSIGEKAKQSEESMRQVMYLSCWGPN
ncbi:uncharacterized protein LOC109832119 [Asparagus officinalis]|uniref:uncharacterized protein LOC109832119 n=1 Tax=Asparagus officinalis TaxID=4686 RepID=UPI00098E6658|nr:uncharacterized protein LOC109832119 [Asparagus officinalis]